MNKLLNLQLLRSKINALVAVFILAVIIFGYIFLNAYYEKLKVQNSEYLMSFAIEKTTNIKNYISARRDVLEYFAKENQLLSEDFFALCPLLKSNGPTPCHFSSLPSAIS